MLKKCIIFVFSIAFVLGSIFPITAAGGNIEDLKQKQQEVQNQINEYRQQAEALKKERDNVQAEINQLDIEISALNLEIEGYDLQKQELTLQIAEKEQEIVKLNEEIDINNEALEDRLRVMYKNGTAGYLEVILKADDLMDALTRIDMIQLIVQSDVDLLKSIEAQKKQVEELQLSLENKREEVVAVQNNVIAKKQEVSAAYAAKEQYIANLRNDLGKVEKLKDAWEEQSAKIERDILAAQRAVEYAGGEMAWPVPGHYKITSNYGPRVHPITGGRDFHRGTDIGAPYGTTVVAANDGVVIYAGSHWSYGNYVIVDHGGGISTLYAHNTKLLVGYGDEVKRGDPVSTVGSTGQSTGPHLHFEVRINGVITEPMNYLR